MIFSQKEKSEEKYNDKIHFERNGAVLPKVP